MEAVELAHNLDNLSIKDIFWCIPERKWPGHPNYQLEVVCGCMFSGKTENLIGRIKRARIAKQQATIFKPIIDTRYEGIYKVNSHSGVGDDAVPVRNARAILETLANDEKLKETLVVGIDEAQFFDQEIVEVCQGLVAKKFRVVVAGLNTDFTGEPFGSMPQLLTYAQEITKLHAICSVCGEHADFTQRIVNGNPANYNDELIVIGASETYEARCLDHHQVPGKPSIV